MHPPVSEEPDAPVLLSPPPFTLPSTGYVTSSAATLTASFSDPNVGDTGRLLFQLCATSTCDGQGDPIATGASTESSIPRGGSGSWVTPVLLDGHTYFWRVQAQDQWGTRSDFSAAREFRVDRTAPAASGVPRRTPMEPTVRETSSTHR